MWRLRAALLGGLVAAISACDGGAWLRTGELRGFRELDAAEAHERLAGGRALLVQVHDRRLPGERQRGATLVEPEGPLPSWVLAAHEPVVVVAQSPESARRLAARLVRAGVAEVSIVRGGIEAWVAARGGSAERGGGRRET
jgi:rhodanese-related sulfurtransferase